MVSRAAAIAANRFGLGARPGELAEADRDPKAWLAAQLARPVPLAGDLPSTGALIAELRPRAMRAEAGGDEAAKKAMLEEGRQVLLREIAARLRHGFATPAAFHERLVWFWSNHFTVSVLRKPRVMAVAGAFEREAIRPHVTARFGDMLRAVIGHPAMLVYLDNVQSFGPNSRAGQRRDKGLNENLARELLELHTLGVAGGFTQSDVGQMARMLTGWSIAREPGEGDRLGFAFHPMAHEPGPKTLLGRRYDEAGQGEVEAALRVLAVHPATATHIATKLARHFIADVPPADSVARLRKAFLESGGDLPTLHRALLDDPNAWGQQMAKLKTPLELIVSAIRAYGGEGANEQNLIGVLRQLGHMPFAASSPAGYPDTADAWAGPEMVMERLEWCAAAGRRLAQVEPMRLAEQALGPTLRPEAATAIREAPSAAVAVGLLFAAPEFQRR